MNADLKIDHLLTKVDAPQEAGDWFEQCGFTVTPLSVIGSMGLCNRLVLFAPGEPRGANFIELMGTLPGAAVQPAMAQLLSGTDGTRSMVLVSQDAKASRELLAARGFAPGEVHNVTRTWELPGESLDLAFDVLLPMQAPLLFNVCRYYTLEHYLRPQWTRHANGVLRVDAVMGVVADIEEAGAFYERLFSVACETIAPGHKRVRPGDVALDLFTPQSWSVVTGTQRAPGFAGYRLQCEDAEKAAQWFSRAGAKPLFDEARKAWRLTAFGNEVLLADAVSK